MQLDRLEYLLENWAHYMRQPSHKLGYPSRSLCIANGYSLNDQFEIMCENMDTDNAITLDAMIDSLPPAQSCAIHHKWLSAVYKVRSIRGSGVIGIEQAYELALDNLMMMADRRGLV